MPIQIVANYEDGKLVSWQRCTEEEMSRVLPEYPYSKPNDDGNGYGWALRWMGHGESYVPKRNRKIKFLTQEPSYGELNVEQDCRK